MESKFNQNPVDTKRCKKKKKYERKMQARYKHDLKNIKSLVHLDPSTLTTFEKRLSHKHIENIEKYESIPNCI